MKQCVLLSYLVHRSNFLSFSTFSVDNPTFISQQLYWSSSCSVYTSWRISRIIVPSIDFLKFIFQLTSHTVNITSMHEWSMVHCLLWPLAAVKLNFFPLKLKICVHRQCLNILRFIIIDNLMMEISNWISAHFLSFVLEQLHTLGC